MATPRKASGPAPGFAAAGLFAGPAAWFLGQQLSYVLVAPSCTGGGRFTIALLNLGLLALCLLGTWPSWRVWRDSGHHSPAQERRRFLGTVGTLAGLLFALVILIQGSVDLVFTGCER